MRIKGKTTIELTDVNTNAVETYEDSNMITNAMANFYNPFGVFGNYPANDENINDIQPLNWLTGGLMLFDKPIAENVNTVYMPAGVAMVGNGAKDISNSGNVTNMGSFNNTESSITQEGDRVTIKYVYDFLTSQANGNIACACLTSKAGGYMGMGNATSRERAEEFNLETYQSGSYGNEKKPYLSFNNYSYAPYCCLAYPVYEEDAIYIVDPKSVYYAGSSYADQRAMHWSQIYKIKIHKMRAGFKSIGLLDGAKIEHSKQVFDVDVPQDIITFMGTSTRYTNVFSDPKTRTIYIVFSKNDSVVPAGSSFYVMKISENMTVTSHQITNNTGFELYIGDNGSSSGYRRVAFDGESIYMWARMDNTYSNYKLFKINLADSTQVFETTARATTQAAVYKIANGLLAIEGDFISGYNYYNSIIYDTINDTIKNVNGYGSSVRRLTPFADKSGVYIAEDMISNDIAYSVVKDPRYLATINNLSTPVEKTAEKTMKVIYTLTYEV